MQNHFCSATSPSIQSLEEISQAVDHRRNFAIISHPHAGKTTLTEKGRLFNTQVVQDRWKSPVLLFKNQWNLEQILGEYPDLKLSNIAIPPTV